MGFQSLRSFSCCCKLLPNVFAKANSKHCLKPAFSRYHNMVAPSVGFKDLYFSKLKYDTDKDTVRRYAPHSLFDNEYGVCMRLTHCDPCC